MTDSHIYVVDDDPSTRLVIGELAAAMQVDCQAFTTAEEFMSEHPAVKVALIISEFRLLGINGVELQRRLNQESRGCQLMFYTAYAETPLTVAAMRNGAVTVLDKPAREQDLWDAMRHGLTQAANDRRLADHRAQVRSKLEKLSGRERRVLHLMMEGCPNKTIARQMEVSVRTIEACRHNIFRKTRTDSIAELVRQVIETEQRLDER